MSLSVRRIRFVLSDYVVLCRTDGDALLVCPPVICPFPNTDPGKNHTTPSAMFILSPSENDTSDSGSFEHWWSKTNTIPLYLIVLLLPLLCFRSASFFARFTFLGKMLQEQSVSVLLEMMWIFVGEDDNGATKDVLENFFHLIDSTWI